MALQQHAHARATRRERGSIIILVVVALTLMALLGSAYLQLVRLDRQATRQIAGTNIDRVAGAMIVYLGDVLAKDILNSSGLFFVPTEDEYYDHFFTNEGVTFPVIANDGVALGNAVGGILDDTWLAATTPDFDTDASKPRWPHITNLNGIWIRIPKAAGSNATPTRTNGGELIVDNGSYLRTDTNKSGTIHIKITGDTQSLDISTPDWEANGADADGDGIPDSRWTWATIRQIAGVSYVVAVRIIDNSSMVNLNSATAMTSDGGVTWLSVNDLPRGYFPTSATLPRLLSRFSGVSATWADELATDSGNNSLFALRGVTASQVATPFGITGLGTYPAGGSYTSLTTRTGAWLDRVSLYGYSTASLGLQSEIELRYKNGLNNDQSSAEVETRMPTLLRNASTGESDWTVPAGGSTAAAMRSYWQGGAGAINSRNFVEGRHLLTTRSGHAAFAPNYNNIHAGARTLKYDLVYQDNGAETASPDTRITNIAARMASVLKIGTVKYLGIASDALLDQIATEYAIAIHDYGDSNNNPTGKLVSGVTYYGMEVMPFIREVYLQMAYEDKDLGDINGNTPAAGVPPYDVSQPDVDNFFDTWERVNASRCMVIEIGNPFDRPITGTGATIDDKMLHGRIKIVVRDEDTAAEVASYTFDATAPDIPSRGNLVVYSNPTTAVLEGGLGGALPTDLQFSGASPTPVNAGTGTLFFPLDSDTIDGTKFTVELQVNTDPGGTANWVTYDRMFMSDVNISVPQYVAHENLDATARHRHVQVSAARDGTNIRYVSNTGRGLVAAARSAPTDWAPGSPGADDYRRQSNSPVDALTQNTKGSITGDTSLDNFQIPVANRPIFSIAELGWIGMFGFSDEGDTNGDGYDDGDFPQRFSGIASTLPVVGTTSTIHGQRKLPEFESAVPNATGIPHAAMLLEQFTTLSPRHDGLDNDNDDDDANVATGVDNDAEQFIPGTLNINTLPLHTATLTVPLPESLADVEAILTEVINYRDTPADRDSTLTHVTGLRSAKGISSMGELLLVNPNDVAAGTSYNEDMMRYGTAGGGPQTGTNDLYPMPENSTATAYSNLMTAEGRMARWQYLSQALTTRSDIYTAYIYIRGYPAADWRLGPVESMRLFVVFDRSNITSATDKPRILAVYTRN